MILLPSARDTFLIGDNTVTGDKQSNKTSAVRRICGKTVRPWLHGAMQDEDPLQPNGWIPTFLIRAICLSE